VSNRTSFRSFVSALASGGLWLGLAAATQAQPVPDPDWPCVQRLVPELAEGQMWAGPPLASVEGFWIADPVIAPMVTEIADIARPMDEVALRIDDFVEAAAEAEREARLTMLFQGTLDYINGERARVIERIKRYARGQRALADQIAQDSAKLHGIRVDIAPEDQPPEIQATLARRDWDLRVFDDRMSMLSQVCDQPVLLEQRVFAVARVIQGHL
jgi:hypothetical protein